MSGATVKRPAADFGVLHWTAAGALFELRSPDPAVLDRARIIFGPWLNGASTRHPPKARFFVEAVRRDGRGRWRVVRDGSEMKVVKSRDLALTAVEYGSIVELLKPESGVVAIHAA